MTNEALVNLYPNRMRKKLYTLAGELGILRDQLECSYVNDFCIESLVLKVHSLGSEIECDCKSRPN